MEACKVHPACRRDTAKLRNYLKNYVSPGKGWFLDHSKEVGTYYRKEVESASIPINPSQAKFIKSA